MNKYSVLFCIPAQAIQDWVATVSESERNEQTQKLMKEWQDWADMHAASIVERGMPIGKTKQVSADGVTDVKNDLNWFMIVQAESHDAAAQLFVGHPHLQIPSSYIQVMDSSRPTEM